MKKTIGMKAMNLFYEFIKDRQDIYIELVELDEKEEAKQQIRFFLEVFNKIAKNAKIELKLNDITGESAEDREPSWSYVNCYAGVFTGLVDEQERFAIAKENLILAINETLAVAEADGIVFLSDEKKEIFDIEITKEAKVKELFDVVNGASLAYLNFVPQGKMEEAKDQMYGILCALDGISKFFEIKLDEEDIIKASMAEVNLKETFRSSFEELEQMSKQLPYVEKYGRYGERPIGDGHISGTESFDRLKNADRHLLDCITEIFVLANSDGIVFSDKEVCEIFGIGKKKIKEKKNLTTIIPAEEKKTDRQGGEEKND